jgi:hypothetical protein
VPWAFTLRTDSPGIVSLGFDVPTGISAHVFDRATGLSTDARSGYRVVSPGDGVPRNLQLRVGEVPLETAPETFGLDPSFRIRPTAPLRWSTGFRRHLTFAYPSLTFSDDASPRSLIGQWAQAATRSPGTLPACRLGCTSLNFGLTPRGIFRL